MESFEEALEENQEDDLEIIEEVEEIAEEYEEGTLQIDDDEVVEEIEEFEEIEEELNRDDGFVDDNQNTPFIDFDDTKEVKQYVGDDNTIFQAENVNPNISQSNNFESEKTVEKVTGGMIILSIIGMVFTAYQVAENPDGAFASICRLCITIAVFLIKLVMVPFRKVFGGSSTHHPISTPDYREPYMGRHHFEIS